jgi:hypothetical protein
MSTHGEALLLSDTHSVAPVAGYWSRYFTSLKLASTALRPFATEEAQHQASLCKESAQTSYEHQK